MKVELLCITPNAEELIENAGRTCYQSIPSDGYIVGTLIKSLIKSGHESVLEHGYATFRISEISRALTHQLVRHRIASYSQQSQRYVNEKQFDYVTPLSILKSEKNIASDYIEGYCTAADEFKYDMIKIQKMYDKWKNFGLKNEDARFVLPNACHTEIVMSANFREYRNIFKVRCDKHAQWEIRDVTNEMLKQLYEKCPNIFEDLKIQFLN